MRKKRQLTVAVDASDDDDSDIAVPVTTRTSCRNNNNNKDFLLRTDEEAGPTNKTELYDLFLRNPLEAIRKKLAQRTGRAVRCQCCCWMVAFFAGDDTSASATKEEIRRRHLARRSHSVF